MNLDLEASRTFRLPFAGWKLVVAFLLLLISLPDAIIHSRVFVGVS